MSDKLVCERLRDKELAEEEDGIQNQKQEHHTKMLEKRGISDLFRVSIIYSGKRPQSVWWE